MLPTDQFSHNIGPIWTPEIWHSTPEMLMRKAQLAIFEDRNHLEGQVLTAPDLVMAGTNTAPQNESDQIIAGDDSSRSKRGSEWQNILGEMRNTEPIVWSDKPVKGGINPAP